MCAAFGLGGVFFCRELARLFHMIEIKFNTSSPLSLLLLLTERTERDLAFHGCVKYTTTDEKGKDALNLSAFLRVGWGGGGDKKIDAPWARDLACCHWVWAKCLVHPTGILLVDRCSGWGNVPSVPHERTSKAGPSNVATINTLGGSFGDLNTK